MATWIEDTWRLMDRVALRIEALSLRISIRLIFRSIVIFGTKDFLVREAEGGGLDRGI